MRGAKLVFTFGILLFGLLIGFALHQSSQKLKFDVTVFNRAGKDLDEVDVELLGYKVVGFGYSILNGQKGYSYFYGPRFSTGTVSYRLADSRDKKRFSFEFGVKEPEPLRPLERLNLYVYLLPDRVVAEWRNCAPFPDLCLPKKF